ncbi:unnamed protein product [Penicillium salamii]|uniref:Uncharacterized protein n=1 Tax=Penicillium salamii TaxID=1612424 RepID=A0A9W4IID8_9EURO|nr:unnamed protein product [Penicillium salamii]CAG8251389.1 unnamed protein product [Penicillium salamii]CAG8283825.1 unnamed protein product [Penicillium salamii]CAG8385371.1 unnamed protein product [Penicillium salamii]CAG8390601.1 unnamed protein product [Penicillium salamii]
MATFECSFAGCNASYQRKEHLRRHELKHCQHQAFPCSNCDREFARSDTLRRHVWQHHKIKEPSARARQACEGCRATKSRCQGGLPCNECIRRSIECNFRDQNEEDKETSVPLDPTLLSEKRDHYIQLYFEKFHPKWPFVHRGSFDVHHETPLLVQSMVVLGMWTSDEETTRRAAVDIHNNLDLAICQQKEKWDASEAEEACSDCHWPLPTYQAILLHIIFSILHTNAGTLDMDLRFTVPTPKLELLASLVRSCQRLGMFYYPNMLSRHREIGVSDFIWVSIEEIKQFNLALFKVCGKVTVINARDNEEGVGTVSMFPAEELQFPMPTNCFLWHAVTQDQWVSSFEGTVVDLDDLSQDTWISNCAGLLNFMFGY